MQLIAELTRASKRLHCSAGAGILWDLQTELFEIVLAYPLTPLTETITIRVHTSLEIPVSPQYPWW